MLVRVFLAALAATPAMAAEVSISGEVDMHLYQYSSTTTSPGLDQVEVDSAGSEDTYSRMATKLDEAELKFKAKGKTANGWKVGTEVELEIGQEGKNDFELEEGSAYVDFGSVKLIGGWLEDWGVETGAAATLDTAEDPVTKHGNEGPAFRIAIGGIENLDIDVKLRFQDDSYEEDVDGDGEDDEFDITRNETMVRAKYDFGMGYARIVYSSLSDKPVNSDAMGDYSYTESVTDLLIGLEFGQIAPFFEMTNINKKKTKVLGSESEDKFSQMVLGVDFEMSKQLVLTGAYMTQQLDDGGDEKAKKTDMSVGALYKAKPAEFLFSYFTAKNNYSDYGGGEDASLSGMKAAMRVKF